MRKAARPVQYRRRSAPAIFRRTRRTRAGWTPARPTPFARAWRLWIGGSEPPSTLRRLVRAWALTWRKFADSIMIVIRVQKLSMPGTEGEPAGSPFAFREERRCPKNSLPTSSRWRSSEVPASQSRTKGLAAGSLRTSAISRS